MSKKVKDGGIASRCGDGIVEMDWWGDGGGAEGVAFRRIVVGEVGEVGSVI